VRPRIGRPLPVLIPNKIVFFARIGFILLITKARLKILIAYIKVYI